MPISLPPITRRQFINSSIAVGGTAAFAKGGDHAEKFGQIDADGNGQITQAEMTAHAQARFAAADTNGDGALDATEMLAARGQHSGRKSQRMLKKFDADNNGSLDADELEKAAASHGGKRRGRMMKNLDADGDGFENNPTAAAASSLEGP